MTDETKADRQKTWLAGEAVEKYDNFARYKEKESLRHGLGHIMATTIAHSEHLMDFDYAKNNMLKNRVAGYEAECLANVYALYLASYPMPISNALKIPYCDESEIPEILRDGTKNYAKNQTEKDLVNITSTNGDKHLEHRLIYAKNFDQIKWPSLKEIKFHMKAATKFCDEFAKKHDGKYPSEFSDEELAKMPLSNFAIDHEFPDWIKKEWTEQTRKWNAALKKPKEKNEAERWVDALKPFAGQTLREFSR